MDTVVFRWIETPSAIFPMIPYGPLIAKSWMKVALLPLLVSVRETGILIDYIETDRRTLVTVANGFTCCLFLLSIFAKPLHGYEVILHLLSPPAIMKKATRG
jgi:hypothetical protein